MCTVQHVILQVLQSLDSLRQAPKQTMSDLENECLPSLHLLFSMTLFPIGQSLCHVTIMWLSCDCCLINVGKCAVSHILALGCNINILLPFVEPKGTVHVMIFFCLFSHNFFLYFRLLSFSCIFFFKNLFLSPLLSPQARRIMMLSLPGLVFPVVMLQFSYSSCYKVPYCSHTIVTWSSCDHYRFH